MNKNIVCFGEVLWDMLPTGTVPGGAPMNVAIRAQSFGLNAAIISRIGNDELGQNLKKYLKERGVETTLLQTDEKISTGKVNVTLDSNGVASYEIKYPSAWDKIELTESVIEKVKNADAFVFGSLSCRDEISRKTLLSLLNYAKFKIFDVNLRPAFFDISLIEKLMRSSDLVKMNDEELVILAKNFGSNSNKITENIQFLSEKLQLNSICITKGEKGAVLFANKNFYSNKGIKVDVADTVGAGDSFLAALIFKLLSNTNHQETLNFACAVGSVVATKTGANPEIKGDEINKMIQQS